MYGLVFEILEDFVLEKKGKEIWHEIKKVAGCDVKDKGFLRRSYYKDEDLIDIVVAASKVLEADIPTLLEIFGHFVIHHHYLNGYNDLLRVTGSTLRQWLSNLNAMHDHVQKSFDGDQFIAPIFWCEDCDEIEGSILLHYYSLRGTLLVPMTVGIVKELASYQFGVEVTMTELTLQGKDNAEFTTWRITAVDPENKWKLSPKHEEKELDFSKMELPDQCPFSGKKLKNKTGEAQCPHMAFNRSKQEKPVSNVGGGLSAEKLQTVFPFHLLVDREFTVLQVGTSLPSLLKCSPNDLLGQHIGDVIEITRPVLGSGWDWKALQKLQDQTFFLAPKASNGGHTSLKKKVSMEDASAKFRGCMIDVENDKVMFALMPDARDVTDLRKMGLTLTDLPLHSSERDAVFLGEYITQEVNKAHNLDKLSKRLKQEQALSDTLLHNLLPKSVAEDLRRGKMVKPKLHENVTCFFSDVVNFTSICDQVEPWDVIDLLNQLYLVMDFLATEFNLYKVETIGDAYVAVSGIPFEDELHAENIANFAIAVQECVKQVRSPVDGSPIQLRIGLHTGSCTAGVVGTLTPHFCLFGDMVNTTSRHESSAEPGRIQCSSVLFGKLKHFSKFESEQYAFTPRGLVDMKGKGECYTYWLENGTTQNQRVNPTTLKELSDKVADMLSKKTWKMRKYFRRTGALRQETASVSSAATSLTSMTRSSVDSDFSSTHDDLQTTTSVSGVDSICDPAELDDFLPDAEHTTCSSNSASDISFSEMKWGEAQESPVKGGFEGAREILSSVLRLCVSHDMSDVDPGTFDLVEGQLSAFLKRIFDLYEEHTRRNEFHNFAHASQVAEWANFIVERAQKESPTIVAADPWYRFAVVFAALVRDCRHTGCSNSQLEKEGHPIALMYPNGLCQERFSVETALTILADDFPDLYDEVIFGCPRFLHLVRMAVFTNGPSSMAAMEFALSNQSNKPRDVVKRNDAVLSHALAFASIGHYALPLEKFVSWNKRSFDETLSAHRAKRGFDPRIAWFENQVEKFENEILPLISQCERITSSTLGLEESAAQILEVLRKDKEQRWFVRSRSLNLRRYHRE